MTEEKINAEAAVSKNENVNIDPSRMAGSIGRRKKFKRNNRKANLNQAKILVHLYKHESLSMPELRKMFNLSKITSWRYMGQMKKAGLVMFKGHHRNGAYHLTDAGRQFVKEKK